MAVTAQQLRQEAERKLEKAKILERDGFIGFMCYLPSGLKTALRARAEKDRRPMREVMIEALKAYLGQ